MASLVEAIAKALVSKPDEVVVTTEGTEDNITVFLKVAKDDMGKNKRVSVEIVED